MTLSLVRADGQIEAAELAAGPDHDLLPARVGMAVVQASPASSPSTTAAGGVGRRVGLREHQPHRIEVQVLARDAGWTRQRLVLPLVGQDEVDVAEHEHRQRLLGLRLDELAAQSRGLAREGLHCGHGEHKRGRLERRDAAAAGHVAGRRGELRLGQLGALEQSAGMPDEHERGIGQPHASARRLGSSTPASRSRTPSCCETADGVNCRASATAAIVPRACSSWSSRSRCRSARHPEAMLLNHRQERESFLMASGATIAPCQQSG